VRTVLLKQAGRINPLFLIVVVAAILAGAVLFSVTGGDTPESTARKFLTALGKGDVKQLTALSYVGNETPAQIEKQWDYACNIAGPYYRYLYQVTGVSAYGTDVAAVKMKLIRDINKQGSSDEDYEIPLLKENGKWLVDVRSLNYKLYPALPK